jgi:hypothetical protein
VFSGHDGSENQPVAPTESEPTLGAGVHHVLGGLRC